MLSIPQEFLGDCFYDIHMKPLINILEGIFDKTHDTLEDDVALGMPIRIYTKNWRHLIV